MFCIKFVPKRKKIGFENKTLKASVEKEKTDILALLNSIEVTELPKL